MDREEEIIKYLDGEMTPEEATSFEGRVDSGPELKEEIESFRQIIEASNFNAELELRKDLSLQLKEYSSKQPKVVPLFRRRRVLGIAAATLVIGGFLTLTVVKTQNSGNEIIMDKREIPVKSDSSVYSDSLRSVQNSGVQP